MIIIRTDAQSNRKALVGALSELFHEKPRYCGAPTFSYEFGVGQLARDASLHLVPSLNETAAERLAAALAERGFSCAVETVCSEIETEDNAPCEAAAEESPLPDSRFTVTIPADRLSPDALARLRNLIASRHRLFCDALNAAELPVLEKGKTRCPDARRTALLRLRRSCRPDNDAASIHRARVDNCPLPHRSKAYPRTARRA